MSKDKTANDKMSNATKCQTKKQGWAPRSFAFRTFRSFPF